VQISLKDIEKAFAILDKKNEGQKVSLTELKRKVPTLNPNFPISELGSLTQGKAEIKAKDLFNLLRQNELQDFDPMQEAFNLLDSEKCGSVDIGRLKQVFHVLGYPELDRNDIEILKDSMDLDKDGKISF